MTSVDITTRKAEATERLDALRKQSGIAALDGRAFDHAQVAKAEAEITALDEAESEQRRRDRASALAEAIAMRTAAANAFARLETRRVAAIAEAEQAAHTLASALGHAFAIAAEQRNVCARIGLRAPLALGLATFSDRLAKRLASVLSTISPDHRYRMSEALTWNASGLKPSASWSNAEEALLSLDVDRLHAAAAAVQPSEEAP